MSQFSAIEIYLFYFIVSIMLCVQKLIHLNTALIFTVRLGCFTQLFGNVDFYIKRGRQQLERRIRIKVKDQIMINCSESCLSS